MFLCFYWWEFSLTSDVNWAHISTLLFFPSLDIFAFCWETGRMGGIYIIKKKKKKRRSAQGDYLWLGHFQTRRDFLHNLISFDWSPSLLHLVFIHWFKYQWHHVFLFSSFISFYFCPNKKVVDHDENYWPTKLTLVRTIQSCASSQEHWHWR